MTVGDNQKQDQPPVLGTKGRGKTDALPEVFLVELSVRRKDAVEPGECVAFGVSIAQAAVRVETYRDALAAATNLTGQYDIVSLKGRIAERLDSLFQKPSMALTEITKYYDAWSQLGVVELSGLDAAGQPIVRYELRRSGESRRLALHTQVEIAVGDAKERVQREQLAEDELNLPDVEIDARPADEQDETEVPPPDADALPVPAPSRARGPGLKGRR